MKEVNVALSATEWLNVGAAAERLGVSVDEFTQQALKHLADTILLLPKHNGKQEA